MPTYILTDRKRVTIARRPLTVSVTAQGPVGRVVLSARRGQAPDPTAVVPRASLMILRQVVEPVTIRVTPANGGGVFPDATVVRLTIETDGGAGSEADMVVLQPVDVSGLACRDLAVVEVEGQGLAVTAMNAIADAEIGRLPAAARGEARAALGVDRVGDEHALDLVLGIDVSASMAPAIGDGSVRAVVDVVTGLSQVVGWGKQLRICLLGEHRTWLPTGPLHECGDRTMDEIRRSGLECGFRSDTSGPGGMPQEGPSVTYIVTDGVPADLGGPAVPDRAPDARRHLVVLSAGIERRDVPASVPCTILRPPPAGSDATSHLLGARPTLSQLVSSLLPDDTPPDDTPPDDTPPDGTTVAARVNR